MSRILAIDIGGTGLKAALVSPKGKFISARLRVETPRHPTPDHVIKALLALVAPLKGYDRVSIGFPGAVRNGVVLTAPNLGSRIWAGCALAALMQRKLGKPVRLNNDADIQGLAAIRGKGLELVCTLGTGFGTAWFRDGELLPHMDLAHMAIRPEGDFDNYIGDRARKKIGRRRWNRRISKLIEMLTLVFHHDRLYLGGGNAKRIDIALPRNVSIISNDAGLEGGAFVWRAD